MTVLLDTRRASWTPWAGQLVHGVRLRKYPAPYLPGKARRADQLPVHTRRRERHLGPTRRRSLVDAMVGCLRPGLREIAEGKGEPGFFRRRDLAAAAS